MRKILSVAMIGSFLFTACNNGDSSTGDASFDSSVVTNTKPVTQITDSPAVSTIVQPAQNTLQTLPAAATAVVPTTTVTTPTPTTTTATAPGMNPPHGQPGHRCDITVGAPLNSPPGKTATTAPATQPVVTSAAQPAVTSTPTTPPVKTAPGMNPPHGEPAHRCDISVGAPLNSPPAKTTTNKTATETKTSEAVPSSISIDTSKKQ